MKDKINQRYIYLKDLFESAFSEITTILVFGWLLKTAPIMASILFIVTLNLGLLGSYILALVGLLLGYVIEYHLEKY